MVPVGVGMAASPADSPLVSVRIALPGTGFAADAKGGWLLVMVKDGVFGRVARTGRGRGLRVSARDAWGSWQSGCRKIAARAKSCVSCRALDGRGVVQVV